MTFNLGKFVSKFEHWQNQTLPQVEESIPLRILVQILVFVGIWATDNAAGINNGIWSVPLSAIGAVWAYRSRYQRNVLVKFWIAVAMIVMLVVFLNDLVRQIDDTKLLLAKLLIQLQVLHSFDLPRRKDLGYSMVIALILVGVAGTLSQTMVFGIWLALFLAIALPVLIHDHYARLGITVRQIKLERSTLLPLGGLFLAALVIGLSIFAILPRFSGYQLRTFPVSTNINLERQVPPGEILSFGRNPNNQNSNGANRASGSGAAGEGESGQEGELAVLPPLFAEQLDISEPVDALPSQPQLVMRVRSQAELFWRVLGYDLFSGKAWQQSQGDRANFLTVKRLPFNYEFNLALRLTDFRPTDISREVIQTYTITTDRFPNLIPAANLAYRLYFPSEEIDLDPLGGLRAPSQLPEELTYTVISQVPLRDRTALTKANLNRPIYGILGENAANYFQVPPELAPKLQQVSRQLVDQAANVATGKPLNLDNNYDIALYLAQALKQKYRLISPIQSDADQVSQFLEQRGGTPSQFSSLLTLMLRSLNIPSRLVVGFAPGRFNPFTGFYEVYNTDTISLVEVFFPGYGWYTFDPVPGRPLFPASVDEDRTFSVLQQFWQWVAGWLPSPIVGFFQVVINQIGLWLAGAIALLIGALTNWGWTGLGAWLILIFSLGIIGWGSWQVGQWYMDYRRLARLPLVSRYYQQMLTYLAFQGFIKQPNQTPAEYADQVSSHIPHQETLVQAISQIYQDWYYGDQPGKPNELKQLLRQLIRFKARKSR
ncbi:MAG: transglutaminaseTgpA domain-containing protein [Pseudanabaenaceae cyanobacterium bins.68]|nr:transglutaminaseTgpA domain-containing protein [Pseudanabaenaceae cyanobacterium bins.68]